MSDIKRISELREKDEKYSDWEDWPYPTITITSRVTGELRARILAKLDLPDGEVLIEESEVSGGYSEFTQETDYGIRILVGGEERWKDDLEWSADTAMAAFLKWAGVEIPKPSPGLPPT